MTVLVGRTCGYVVGLEVMITYIVHFRSVHTLVLYVVPYRNADPLKELVFHILTSIPHEA